MKEFVKWWKNAGIRSVWLLIIGLLSFFFIRESWVWMKFMILGATSWEFLRINWNAFMNLVEEAIHD
jgi:hypothetical protein